MYRLPFSTASTISSTAANGSTELSTWSQKNQKNLVEKLGVNVDGIDRLYELISKDDIGLEKLGIEENPSNRIREMVLGLCFGYQKAIKEDIRSLRIQDKNKPQLYQAINFAEAAKTGVLEFFPLSLFKTSDAKYTELNATDVDAATIESCDLSGLKYAFLQAPFARFENCLVSNAAFTYSNLAEVYIANTEFYDVDFLSCVFGIITDLPTLSDSGNYTHLVNVGFKGCTFDDVQFSRMLFRNVKMRDCKLDQVSNRNGSLPDFLECVISRSDLTWENANPRGNALSSFHSTRFRGADLGENVDCVFDKCTFEMGSIYANATNATGSLAGTKFRNCHFAHGFELNNELSTSGSPINIPRRTVVDLRGTDFTGCTVGGSLSFPTPADFLFAKNMGYINYDDTTIYTDGLPVTATRS